MKTILNVKTDKDLKKKARKIAEKIGVPLSTVVNSFLKQFVRDEEVIFSVKEYRMTPYLEGIVAEAENERIHKKSPGYFNIAEEMIRSLNN
jgi:DNA-damage-inducible protein J